MAEAQRFVDGGSGDGGSGGRGGNGGGNPGSGTGSSGGGSLPATENGGVFASTYYLFTPVQEINTLRSYIGYYDVDSFNDPVSGSHYSYRSEDVENLRVPTVRRVGLVYRDLGPVKLTVRLSGSNDKGQHISKQVEVQLGNLVPTNALLTNLVDITLVAFRPQLTLLRAPGAGPLSIVSATLIGAVETTTL